MSRKLVSLASMLGMALLFSACAPAETDTTPTVTPDTAPTVTPDATPIAPTESPTVTPTTSP